MQRRELLAGLGVASLSGCLRMVSGGDDGEGTTDPETTAPPQTTTAPTETGSPELPDGLNEDGVTQILFDTHQRELVQTGFQTEFTTINLNRDDIKMRKKFDVESGLALGSWVYSGGGPVSMLRSNEGAFWREDLGSKYTYGEARYRNWIDSITWRNWIEPVLSAGEWSEPITVQDQNQPLWRVETTGLTETDSVPGWFNGQLDALSASMTVSPRGIIHELSGEFEASLLHGGVAHHSIDYIVESIGEVSVSEPPWLSTAKEQRPRVNAALGEDRKFAKWTLESGNPIEPGTRCVIYDENERIGAINYHLNDSIDTGETVYFYKEQNQPRTGQMARGSPPTDASPVTLDSEYNVWADRNGTEYFGTTKL